MFTPIGFFAPTDDLPAIIKDFAWFYDASKGALWVDQSGNGNDGTEADATGVASITHTSGDEPYWEFATTDGGTNNPYIDVGLAPGAQSDITLFTLFQDTDLTVNGTFIWAFDGALDQVTIGTSRTDDTLFSNIRGDKRIDNNSTNPILSEDTWYMGVSRQSVSGDTSTLLLNNTELPLTVHHDAGEGGNINVSADYNIGRGQLVATQANRFKIAAIGVAHKRLSDAELTELYDYYKEIYSIPQLLLLDIYQDAYAAWSLRKLRQGYTGNAIQVTRTSDSATQDIGFVGEDLDTSALTTFAGANTCVVSKWYDQSGNSRDITISSALRPTIVSSGTLQTLSGGKPTMKPQSGQLGVDVGFTGLTDKSIFFAGDTTNILGGTAASRVLSGYAGTGAVGNQYIISHYDGTPDFLRLFDQGTTATVNVDRDEIVIGSYASSGTIGLKANALTTATSTGTSAANTGNYHLFEDRGGVINNEIPTFASEYIIYDTSKDSDLADIMTNINDYYSIY